MNRIDEMELRKRIVSLIKYHSAYFILDILCISVIDMRRTYRLNYGLKYITLLHFQISSKYINVVNIYKHKFSNIIIDNKNRIVVI